MLPAAEVPHTHTCCTVVEAGWDGPEGAWWEHCAPMPCPVSIPKECTAREAYELLGWTEDEQRGDAPAAQASAEARPGAEVLVLDALHALISGRTPRHGDDAADAAPHARRRKYLSFGAAGAYGYAYCGVLRAIERSFSGRGGWSRFISHLGGASGTSAGALAAVAVVCGASPAQLGEFVVGTSMKSLLCYDIAFALAMPPPDPDAPAAEPAGDARAGVGARCVQGGGGQVGPGTCASDINPASRRARSSEHVPASPRRGSAAGEVGDGPVMARRSGSSSSSSSSSAGGAVGTLHSLADAAALVIRQGLAHRRQSAAARAAGVPGAASGTAAGVRSMLSTPRAAGDYARRTGVDLLRALPSGLLPGTFLTNLARAALQTWSGNPDVTFAELHRSTGRTLQIVSTDLDACAALIFSADTTPNVPVHVALRASMSVPAVFAPVEWRGRLLVDGGVVNTPALALTPPEETLAFAVGVTRRCERSVGAILTRVAQASTVAHTDLVRGALASSRLAPATAQPIVVTLDPAPCISGTGYADPPEVRAMTVRHGEDELLRWLSSVLACAAFCLALRLGLPAVT